MIQEKKTAAITLRAMGKAINKTVTIAEIIKRKVAGLHQVRSPKRQKLGSHLSPFFPCCIWLFVCRSSSHASASPPRTCTH